MSVFRRFRDLFSRDEPAAAAPEPPAPKEPAPAAEPRIADAIALAMNERRHRDVARMLSDGRGAADEGERVEATLAALGPVPDDEAPSTTDADLDALLLLLAEILVDRGARRRACEVLARSGSPSALVLRADLLSEGAFDEGTGNTVSDADLDRALALLARALMRDIDAPGARDRWERLRARLGKVDDTSAPAVGATLVASGGSLPYTIVREVARGGAGVVYEARERIADVERTVALKMAHVRASTRAQLTHEARIAVRFRGPGVIPILDLDPSAGWLAMAWAPGGSLRARLREARKDDPLARDVRAWLRPLISTLDEVHRAGWVHGDVKPANVLFDASDAPMLGDFGLARACGDANTQGSAGYVPPERASGSPCAPSDDVYGIGKSIHDLVATGWADDRLRALADRCTAPIATRPRDFGAILRDL